MSQSGRQIIRLQDDKKNKKKRFFKRPRRGNDSEEEELIKMRPKNPHEALAMRIDLLFKKNAADDAAASGSTIAPIKPLEPGVDLLDPNPRQYPESDVKYTIDLDGAISAANSGDYILYETLKRREAGRLRREERQEIAAQGQAEHAQKVQERRLAEEAKTQKKRAKRIRAKARKKGLDTQAGDATSSVDDSSDDDQAAAARPASQSIASAPSQLAVDSAPSVTQQPATSLPHEIPENTSNSPPPPSKKVKQIRNIRIVDDVDL